MRQIIHESSVEGKLSTYSFAHPENDETIDIEAEGYDLALALAILRLDLVAGDDPILFAIDGRDVPGDD